MTNTKRSKSRKSKLKIKNLPKHVGVILDGNRRFAKKLMLKPWMGHELGAKKARRFLEWCKELNIKEVTLYILSLENFNRPKREFNFLMNIFRREFKKLLTDKRIEKDEVRLNFIGRLNLLPKDLQEILKKLMKKTKYYKKFKINFAIAYGGRAEIVDAINKIIEKVRKGKLSGRKITEKELEKNLYLDSEPDLIIRTSGEQRISGFLPWQGVYSELYFCKKFWPEFGKRDFIKALLSYSKRQRKFGR